MKNINLRGMSFNSEQIYQFLQITFSDIVHKIRTPLSVINNELSCLSNNDAAISIRNCQKIVDILKSIQLPKVDDFTIHSASNLLVNIGLHTEIDNFTIKASAKLLKYFFQQLEKLIFINDTNISYSNTLKIDLTFNDSAISTLLNVNIYTSFSDYFCNFRENEPFIPAILDCILAYHNASVQIKDNHITIEIPRYESNNNISR